MAFWAVLIMEHNGRWHFLREGGGGDVWVYASKMCAETMADSMRKSLGDDVRRVGVARYVTRCHERPTHTRTSGCGPTLSSDAPQSP